MHLFKPEEKLLLNCLKFHFNPDESTQTAIKNLIKKEVDWEYFISITSLNRVIPMAWDTLSKEFHLNIPEKAAVELQKICNEKQTRSIYNLNPLNELLVLFKENNIQMIPFKGPNFNRLYKNYALRQASDLDIIIRKEDINSTISLLKENGYIFKEEYAPGELKKIFKTRHSLPLIDNKGIAEIDIHWRLEDSFEGIGIRFRMEQIWKEFAVQPVLNFTIPVLQAKALILSTCIHHGLRNGWSQLKSICDIAVIIDNNKDLNWEELILDAKKIKLKRVLLTGVFLAQGLLDHPLPYQLKQAVTKDKSLNKIGKIIVHTRLFKNRSSHEIYASNTILRYYMKDNFYAKLHFISRVQLKKLKLDIEDKRFIKLPSHLFFIYNLTKPFRSVKKYVSLSKDFAFKLI